MSTGRVLVTGGLGFIGRHVTRALLERGYEVRILDNLLEQVHGGRSGPVNPPTEWFRGDIRDAAMVSQCLQRADFVVHLAAEVGVGQSMYAIDRYVSANDYGTAVLLQQLTEHRVARVVVASSMSIYGEGLYQDADGVVVEDVVRRSKGNETDGWDPLDKRGQPLTPLATPEWKRPALASVYALTKSMQESLTLTVAPAYGIQGVALRLFNVYGPGQALSNPYTGVLAIFASRLRNCEQPLVFEDGKQRRDFVHVDDVAQAFVLALEHPEAAGGVFNIGSGRDVSIHQVAEELAAAMGRKDIAPELLRKVRAGDIRHCFADISLARRVLGYQPRRCFADSLGELAEWVARQQPADHVARMRRELETRGLVA
jgi:dTDP-L-rhamnose 4-epimerase